MAAPVIVSGILTGGSNSHATTSEEVNAVATDFISEGVVGTFTNTSGVAPATGAFAVNATGTPDANINISTGVAYVTTTPTSQGSQALRIKCTVTGTLAIAANSSGSTKYDWIYLSVSATNAANPNTAADNVTTIVASRSSSASTDDGTPPTYGYPIAVVTVANGFSTITNGNIRDIRTNCIVNLGSSSVSSGWTDLGFNPNTVTALGNRSYSLVFNSTDLTATVSKGMRIKSTRLVAAPTRCTSLNGTSQYYTKTTPSGITFTDDFVAMGWVKLTSYNGATNSIISRYNGTSGWSLEIDSSGRVVLIGYNAGAANFSQIQSYQSVPLNKWIHIAAQLDMSAFDTGTKTNSYITIDGVDAAAVVSRGGTNPTALVQAGDLAVGAKNAGSFFAGKIAQAAVFSAKVTEATILTYISQTLGGAETSIASAYTFNSSISDLTANANNLTANGSAVATNVDSPFSLDDTGVPTGSTDVAIIQSKTFSTNTTLVVQVPEGNTLPTSGGISAVAYSTVKAPFGFPSQTNRWGIMTLIGAAVSSAGTSSTTTYTFGGATAANAVNLNVPIGDWRASLDYATVVTPNATGIDIETGLSSSITAFLMDGNAFSTRTLVNQASTSNAFFANLSRSDNLSLSAATQYYPLIRSANAVTAMSLRGNFSTTVPEQSNIMALPANL